MVSINDIVNYHVYAKNPETGRVISKSEAKNVKNVTFGIRAQDPVTGRFMSQAEAGKRVKSYIGKCLKERPEVSAAAIDERLGINKGENELQKSLRKAENKNGHITFKDPVSGKYVSGTPADKSAALRKAQQDASQAKKNFKNYVKRIIIIELILLTR